MDRQLSEGARRHVSGLSTVSPISARGLDHQHLLTVPVAGSRIFIGCRTGSVAAAKDVGRPRGRAPVGGTQPLESDPSGYGGEMVSVTSSMCQLV